MIGLAIGAGALLGYAFWRHARWHRYAHGYGGGACGPSYGYGGWGHHHGWGGPPWARHHRAHRRLYWAMSALDLSPAQEKLVRTEIDALRERARALRPELGQTREDVARAVSGATFDKAALDGAFARHDKALADLRSAFAGAIERVHASLDDHQRERLAELLDRGGRRGGGPGGGPYRV